MPQAVLHILVPLILMALFKDWYDSREEKRSFSLHYVLLAGLGGIIPDIDIGVFWVLHFFGFAIEEVHRTVAHSLLLPLIFLVLFIVTKNVRVRFIRKHKIKLSIVFLMFAFGSLIHIVLDGIFGGFVMPLFPLSSLAIGLDITGMLPLDLQDIFIPSIEGILFVLWIIYLEVKHKISDFI
jgi:hypothetical protein